MWSSSDHNNQLNNKYHCCHRWSRNVADRHPNGPCTLSVVELRTCAKSFERRSRRRAETRRGRPGDTIRVKGGQKDI